MKSTTVVVSNPLENKTIRSSDNVNVIAASTQRSLITMNEWTAQETVPIIRYNEKVCTTLGRDLYQ